MAEWSACRTCNPAVLGSSPALITTWILFLCSPEFKSSATLENSQLVCLLPVAILNNVMFNFLLVSVVFSAPLTIEGLRAKRAYIAFLANFHFLQDRANFWQTDLF